MATKHPTDRESLERDCTVEFVRASGPGGQHRNKRETGVRLTHTPSGMVVMATERRSQSLNRELAFARMASALDQKQRVQKRRFATRPTKASVRRRLQNKRRKSQRKAQRSRNYSSNDD